jgi:hypothetical protein
MGKKKKMLSDIQSILAMLALTESLCVRILSRTDELEKLVIGNDDPKSKLAEKISKGKWGIVDLPTGGAEVREKLVHCKMCKKDTTHFELADLWKCSSCGEYNQV